jgi:hypothetical protein
MEAKIIFLLLPLFYFSCSHTPSLAPGLTGEGLYYTILFDRAGGLGQSYTLYQFSPQQLILCQAPPAREQLGPFITQEQLRLSQQWKGPVTDTCYRQREDEKIGENLLKDFLSRQQSSRVQVFCSGKKYNEHCLAAIRSLQGSNLNAHEIEKMYCRPPYSCQRQKERLSIFLK